MHKVSISQGNLKMGNVASVSLPPIAACGNCRHCARDCYARKAYRLYPATRAAWDRNLQLARDDRAGYFAQVRDSLRRPRFFRWHVAGDILDQDYLDRMKAIARELPAVKFWAFTKMHDLDFRRLPRNLTIVLSMWPGMPVPRSKLPRAWMQDGTETRIPTNAIECPGNCETCGACAELRKIGRDVFFRKH